MLAAPTGFRCWAGEAVTVQRKPSCHPARGSGAVHRRGAGDEPEIAAKLRIEERELQGVGGLN